MRLSTGKHGLVCGGWIQKQQIFYAFKKGAVTIKTH